MAWLSALVRNVNVGIMKNQILLCFISIEMGLWKNIECGLVMEKLIDRFQHYVGESNRAVEPKCPKL